MSKKFGFTPREISTYFKPEPGTISSYGRIFDYNLIDDDFQAPYIYQRDYIKLFVIDIDTDEILKTSIVRVRDVNPDFSRKTLKLNVGQHLRDLGYETGDYKVLYKFLRKISGDELQYFVVDESGQVYNGPYGVGPNETYPGYYKIVDDVVDLESPVEVNPFTYELDEFNNSGDEISLRPANYISDDVYIRNLRNLDLNLVNYPNKPYRDDLTQYNPLPFSLKFNHTTNTLTLETEQETEEPFKFTQGMVGSKVVFENYIRAYIPVHSKFAPLLDPNDDKHGTEWEGKKEIRPVSDTMFPISQFESTKAEYGVLPFSTVSGQPVQVDELSRYDLEEYSVLGGNYYAPENYRKSFSTTELFSENNDKNLPKYWWLATGRPAVRGHRHGKVGDNSFHFMWDTSAENMYPVYTYNGSNDTDNIDWSWSNTQHAPRTSDGGGDGYKVEQNVKSIFFNFEMTIEKVISDDVVEVSHNLKDEYTKLRESGFKVDAIGALTTLVDLNRLIDHNYKFADYVQLDETVGGVKWPLFHIKQELNKVNDFKSYVQINNDYYLIINSKFELDRLKLKLKQPLNQSLLEEGTSGFTIVEEKISDYNDNVSLVPLVKVNNTFLFEADLDNVDSPIENNVMDYKSHNNLLSTDDELNKKIERELVSGSLLNVQPNIDYQKTSTEYYEVDDTGFGNFVHFSNAERRLRNFKKKLILIESHSAVSHSLINITSALSRIQSIERKRQRVKDSFDPYENFLYYESSSYSSGSNGLFHDTSWPKENSSEPYRLVPSTGSTAVTWFDNMVSSASTYDFNNPDSLRNSLPEHVYADSQNNVFLEFMDMVGQQFDEVWTYTKHFTDVNKRLNNLSEGISKDVARHYVKQLGIDLTNGNNYLNLPEYLFGKSGSGDGLYESGQEKVTEEIYKRILSNLPYFVKTKGTERSLKGILNCYGIPSSILRVREYGGPDKGTRVSYELKRKFTYALDFKSGQYIKSNWKTASDGLIPDTVEFRFRTPKSQDQVILQKNNDWAITLQDNGTTDEYGYLRFSISASDGTSEFITSSLQPFYNDDMWSVMLTRVSSSDLSEFTEDSIYASSSFELITKQYDSTRQRIVYATSQSLTTGMKNSLAAFTSSGHVFLGGSGSAFGTQFTGSLMEYRLWSEVLSQNTFDNHVRTPKAYNGNSFSSSYDELLVRYELNDNINLQTVATASNTSHLKTYENHSVDVNGFTGNFYRSLVDQEKVKIPNIGPSRRNATKIRIEDNTLKDGTQLSYDTSNEKSSQDFAPIDSEKLGVYLSPTDVINEDIIYSLADINFDDFIGDPRDEFEYSYRTLEQKKHEYFKRYFGSNNFWDYMRILSYYDSSIFKTLKNFVPARAKSTMGYVVEPNILERTKEVIGKKPETTSPYYQNAGEFETGLRISRFISGSDNIVKLSGTNPYYESVLVVNTGSRGTNIATLNKINELNPNTTEPTLYATASVTFGGTDIEFEEVVQPFVSSSRVSRFNQIKEFYYTSSLSVSEENGFGAWSKNGNNYIYSQSFEPAEFEASHKDTISNRLFYTGTQLNRLNDITGEDPVQITFTNPTKLVTQTPGESRLKTD